jgi:hypothetical protein
VVDQPKPDGFVSLKSVKHGAPDAASALADIRRIYFETTRKTIENDFAHAIELLKSLPTEDERERATVFMEGLATMRKEWGVRGDRAATGTRSRKAGKTEATGSHRGAGKQGRTDQKTGSTRAAREKT